MLFLSASRFAPTTFATTSIYAIGYILGRGLLYSGEGLGQWTSAAGEMLNEDSIWRQYPLSKSDGLVESK